MKQKDLPEGTFGRVYGVQEQYERAMLFLHEAEGATDQRDRFRRLMASVYFARAMVEIMLEACRQKEVPVSQAAMEQRLREQLPFYEVIYRLRIHDFHRFGIAEIVGGIGLGGPISLVAEGDEEGSGHVSFSIGPQGPVVHTTGRSRVEWGRSLLVQGDMVFDHQAGAYVKLTDVLSRYLDAAPAAINGFKAL